MLINDQQIKTLESKQTIPKSTSLTRIRYGRKILLSYLTEAQGMHGSRSMEWLLFHTTNEFSRPECLANDDVGKRRDRRISRYEIKRS